MNKILYGQFMPQIKEKQTFRTMKITAVALFASVFSVYATGTFSQNAKVSIKVNQQSTQEVIAEIEEQTDYLFVYNKDEINMKRLVSLNIKDRPVSYVLDMLFRNTDVSYQLSGKNISLITKDKTNKSNQIQQVKTITGKIVDINGEPIIGANVVVEGTTTGTITDVDGKFTLNVSQGTTLVVSYIGYNDYTVKIEDQESLFITLKEDSKALEEVVVVGYGTMRKGNLTGAVSSIKSDALIKAPVANVTNTLAGQLPGLQAKQTSGLPGSDQSSLSIRGFGNPLVIVDGIEANLNNIDPNQIENISILKDGAASIYGARAGNGVILVTTKRGIQQKPTISYNGAYTMQGVTHMATPATAGQRAQMEREEYLNAGKPTAGAPWSQEQVDKFFAGNDPAFQNYDWFDHVLRNWAPQWNQNLSIRGGSERIKYMGYFGYTDQRTIIKTNGGGYKRYNMQSNVDNNITDRLKMSVDVMLTFEDRDFPIRGLGDNAAIWQDLYNTQPWYPYYLPDRSKIAWGGLDVGSVAATSNMDLTGYQKGRSRDIRTNVTFSYDSKYVKGLKAKAFISYVSSDVLNKSFTKPIDYYTYNLSTDKYTYAGNFKTQAELRENTSKASIFTQQYSLNYDNVIRNNHSISALALLETIQTQSNGFSAFRGGFLSPYIEELFGGSAASMANDGNANEMGRASFVARVNYGFKNKYLLETIFRADASAKFPSSDRWGFFPSVSVGWVASEENFMKQFTSLDNLKIRASFGQSGNDAVGQFQYLTGYRTGPSYLIENKLSPTLATKGLANPLLTWEKMSIYNVGVDFSFLGRKLYGTVEAFYRSRTGIPGTKSNSLPSSFGSTLPEENLNDLSDRGFDFNIGTSGSVNNFTYDISGNISWSRAKWESFDEPDYSDDPDRVRIEQKTGNWVDRAFGYLSDGLFTSQNEIDGLEYVYQDLGDNTKLRPGDVKYIDLNHDGVLDWKDKTEIGKGNMPHWMYGINANFKYTDFDLSLLFQGAFGYSTNIGTNFYTEYKYDNRWTEATNDPAAIVPRLGGSGSNGWASDYGLKNVSYLRLKNLSFGYNIPKNILAKLSLQKARIYIAGTNIFTISNISKFGIDPEAPNGINKNYPQQRTISFGLNLSL